MEIILFGNQKDKLLTKTLLHSLKNQLPFTYCNGETFYSSPKSELFILETDRLKALHTSNCLVVLKNKANLNRLSSFPETIPCLIDSQNSKQLEVVSRLGLSAITCGMFEKDTLTFSSMGEDSSVVSIQRQIIFNDKVFDPMEIPVRHQKGTDPFALLTSAFVALLYNEDYTEISIL